MNYYDYSERQKIFTAAYQLRFGERDEFTFMHFLGPVLLAGMRVEEVIGLQWEAPPGRREQWPWLDLKAWEIVIPDPQAKGHKRRAPIIPRLGRLLAHWPLSMDGKLFPFPLTIPHVEKKWAETLKLAGVKHISIHELHQTFTYIMQEAGLSAEEIAEILGERTVPEAQ